MKLRDPRWIRLVAFLLGLVVRAWMGTVRVRLRNHDHHEHPGREPARGRFIYAFWHESLLSPIKFRVPVHALISQHADGELIAQVCGHLGFGTVRGSTTRGGMRALLELREVAGRSHLMITPDGPRGPRRRLQLGVPLLASATGLPAVPVGVGFTRAWRFRSWDRFALPKPFSTICLVVPGSLAVPPDLDRDGIEEHRRRIEERMLAATAEAEAWAEALAGRRAVAATSAAVPAPHGPGGGAGDGTTRKRAQEESHGPR
jgi:lysophospholipid acyltransferase (LPLAT)-like uncharacterized protein